MSELKSLPLDLKTMCEIEDVEYLAEDMSIPAHWSLPRTLVFRVNGQVFLKDIAQNDGHSTFYHVHKAIQQSKWQSDTAFQAWLSDYGASVKTITQDNAPSYFWVEWERYGWQFSSLYWPESARG